MEAGLVYGNVFVQQVFDQSGNIINSADTTTSAQRIKGRFHPRIIVRYRFSKKLSHENKKRLQK